MSTPEVLDLRAIEIAATNGMQPLPSLVLALIRELREERAAREDEARGRSCMVCDRLTLERDAAWARKNEIIDACEALLVKHGIAEKITRGAP